MAEMRMEEQTTTLPTVLHHSQADGTTVTEEIGVRSFSDAALTSMTDAKLVGIQIADDGRLLGITVRTDPNFPLQDGVYTAREVFISPQGTLIGFVASDSEAPPPDCEVVYTITGDTINVMCRDNSCPDICELKKTVGPGYIAYRCDCPSEG
jgi:hypothetical protein